MDCTAAKSLLNAYLDGELSGSLAAEFAAHKLQCPACRRELALLEVTGHVLSADTDVPQLDEDFTDRLIACAAAPPPLHRRHRRLLLVIGAPLAAAASLLLVVSLYMIRPKPAEEDKPRETLVLGEVDEMDSAQEMLDQIERARRVHPDSAELAELERALRERVEQIANGSEHGADLLENYGKLTIMELLGSMKLDRPKQNDATPPDANTSGDEHDPRVEDL